MKETHSIHHYSIDSTSSVENDPIQPSSSWRLTVPAVYFFFCLFLPTTFSAWVANWIKNHGWAAFNTVVYGSAVFAGILILTVIVRKIRNDSGSRWGWLGVAGTIGAIFGCQSMLVILSSETIHYPEYALLFILLYWATSRNWGWSLSLSIIGGIVDECLQAVLPRRVCDINDILLNTVGCALGATIVWLLTTHTSQDERV